ncbi:MAG: hypothetical protein WB699_07610 [Bacteroidota bacterium]
MSYKIRNSIALGILLFLIVAVGSYIRAFNQPRKAKQIQVAIKKIDDELQNTPNLINEFNDLSATLNDTQKRWDARSKIIPPTDVTAESYAYFSHLIDISGPIKLDVTYAGNQNKGNYGYNLYTLKGEATFDNFYRFLWYLENNRRLYKVANMALRGVEVAPTDKKMGEVLVTFDMTVQAYYSSVAELSSSLIDRVFSPNPLFVDPFTPGISSGIPPNLRGLVEVERSTLKAVIPGKAFVEDQAKSIRTLQEGDEIYLGYVTRIDPQNGKVECTLNKGGIIDNVELKINYGPTQN